MASMGCNSVLTQAAAPALAKPFFRPLRQAKLRPFPRGKDLDATGPCSADSQQRKRHVDILKRHFMVLLVTLVVFVSPQSRM